MKLSKEMYLFEGRTARWENYKLTCQALTHSHHLIKLLIVFDYFFLYYFKKIARGVNEKCLIENLIFFVHHPMLYGQKNVCYATERLKRSTPIENEKLVYVRNFYNTFTLFSLTRSLAHLLTQSKHTFFSSCMAHVQHTFF